MRGINRVIISGNASGNATYNKTASGTEACSFKIASDRRTKQGVVTAWVKINVYGEDLVNICRSLLNKGIYVLVEGELMNREGAMGELTEVRAKELIFLDAAKRQDSKSDS